MPTLHAHQVGIASCADPPKVLVDVSPLVECPHCDRPMNPTGNIRTHVATHPNGSLRAFYRTHISCAKDALPHEEELLTMRALDLAEIALEQLRVFGPGSLH